MYIEYRPLKVCIHSDLKPYLTEMNILPENLCVTNLRVIYALINFHLYLYISFGILRPFPDRRYSIYLWH